MKSLATVLLFFFLILISCEEQPKLVSASGEIYDNNGEFVGTVNASQLSDRIVLTVYIINDDPYRIRAMHIHEGNCMELGGHWNMGTTEKFCDKISLGSAWNKPYAGDIGNISNIIC